jgi:Tfp pilus assembly protein PilO
MPIKLTNKEIWEQVSKLLALVAVPAIAWAFALNGERAANQIIQAQTEKRITFLESELKTTTKTLTDLKVILAQLSTSAESMQKELERLRN